MVLLAEATVPAIATMLYTFWPQIVYGLLQYFD
jgi:hypothetical protein